MLDYLKKFNNLPAELREKVSNRKALAAIEELERKFKLPLAALIMKVVAREIALKDLASVLLKENLTETAAGQLAQELEEKIFFSLKDYLTGAISADAPRRVSTMPRRISAIPRRVSASLPSSAGPNDQPVVKGASFFFSPDDEQEIRDLAKKIDRAEKIELPAAKIEEKLAAIISRARINFGSADLAERFKQIIKTYLRGIRNRTEAELTLTKPFSSGGLSFDDDSAQKVMDMADKINFKPGSPIGEMGEPIRLSPKIRIPELEKIAENKSIAGRDAPYDFSKLTKEPGLPVATEPRPKPDRIRIAEPKPELAPLTPAVAPAKPPAAVLPAAGRLGSFDRPAQEKKPLPSAEKKISVSDGRTDASQMPLLRRRFAAENSSQGQKARVEDVKYIPRVMSPLDELKYLDLVSFRRLDKDTFRAIDKIRSKINLLEEEGYGKRLEGIRLWRSSPVNRLYLAIGHLSISENKPVDVIIEERKMKAADYLTAAEFKAIMDLNKSLRF